jgi:hypothetical protein
MARFKSYDEEDFDQDDYARGRKFNKNDVRGKRSAKSSSRWSSHDDASNDNSQYEDEY